MGLVNDAHPLIGCSGVFYSPEGREFVAHPADEKDKAWCKNVVTAKIGHSGAAALQEYMEGIGYWLPTPETFPRTVGDKPVLFWNFPGTIWKRIDPTKLVEVLTPHALTNDECAETEDFIFGVIFWQLR